MIHTEYYNSCVITALAVAHYIWEDAMAESGVVRTNISVPRELKARMDRVQGVNWSAVASEAFETKLLELVSKREVKGLDDMIARLRAAAELEANQDYQDGHQMGEKWAAEKATPRQLRRLQALADDPKCSLTEWLNYVAADGMTTELMNKLADNPLIAPKLAEAGALPYSGPMETGIGRALYWCLFPDRVPDRSEVEGFWLNALDTRQHAIEIHDFARGFVEGALGVWEKVRGKL
jgi:hypothetical protein